MQKKQVILEIYIKHFIFLTDLLDKAVTTFTRIR
jgi:hypothetical protein